MEEFDSALSFKLSRLMFEGPEEELLLTSNGQPAIVAHSLMAFEALKVWTCPPIIKSLSRKN